MHILFICSGNTNPVFVTEQATSLEKQGLKISFFYIKGKGIRAYYKSIGLLKKEIANVKPDMLHAHYGLSGFVANLQTKLPVITTYHGSDINEKLLRIISYFSLIKSNFNILVSQKLFDKIKSIPKKKISVIPCGIDLNKIYPITKNLAREKLGLSLDEKIVLFASDFSIPVKNSLLAIKAVDIVGQNLLLTELKDKTRDEVNLLLNACDILLLTSINEGSPQVIKEAMACNCPIVSTNVGDICDIFGSTKGCYICSYDPEDVAEKIKTALEFARTNGRTNGLQRIIELQLDNDNIAKRVLEVYKKVAIK